MTLKEIAMDIKNFIDTRGWKNDNPSHLMVALQTELGELGEYFLWKSEFPKNQTEDERRAVAYEIIDVMIYLIQIANKSGIEDLAIYYQDKIQRLAKKYPVGMSGDDWNNAHKSYKKSGKNKLYE